MSESLKSKTVKGTLWGGIERFSVQGIQFIVMIIMARILTPADYGLVGMLTIFIAISQSLIDSGFSQALIRKQDRSETDNSTVFYFNIVVGVTLYFILFLCAPLISDFYKEPKLTPITRAIGLSLVLNSLAVVQRALYTVNINFKTQAKATLIGALCSGAIGIWMAYAGFGVWAIVTQQLINQGLVTLCLWLFSRWRPILAFSKSSFKELFGFGSKLLASGLLHTIYSNLYLIIIGKFFRASDLGYFTRANQFANFASSNIAGILQRVTYPVLCTIQDNDARLANVYRRLLRTSAYVIFPSMMTLAAVARPMVATILTEKWVFAATLLVPLCFSQMWYPIHAINLNLLQVKGRSDLFLRLEIIKKMVGVAIMCITIPMGVTAMCWGLVADSIIALIINTHYTGKLIHHGFLKQIWDILPILLLSMGTGTLVWFSMKVIPFSPLLKFIIGVVEGMAIYIGASWVLRFNEFSELLSIIRRKS